MTFTDKQLTVLNKNKMKELEIKESAIVGEIKRQFVDFIDKSKSIDISSKSKLLTELGYNYEDDRFDGSKFIESAMEYSIEIWRNENLELAELWREIAIKNAAINSNPYDVANKTVEEFKSSFNIK